MGSCVSLTSKPTSTANSCEENEGGTDETRGMFIGPPVQAVTPDAHRQPEDNAVVPRQRSTSDSTITIGDAPPLLSSPLPRTPLAGPCHNPVPSREQQKKPALSVLVDSPAPAPKKNPSPRGSIRSSSLAANAFHSVVQGPPTATMCSRANATRLASPSADAHATHGSSGSVQQTTAVADGELRAWNPLSLIDPGTTTSGATTSAADGGGGPEEELITQKEVSSIVTPSSLRSARKGGADAASPAIVLHVSFHDVTARVLDQSMSLHDLKSVDEGGEGSLANTMRSSGAFTASSSHSNLLLKQEHETVSASLGGSGGGVAWAPLTPSGVNHRSQRATKRQSS